MLNPINITLDLRRNAEGRGMSTSGFIGAFEILDGSQGTIGPGNIIFGLYYAYLLCL